MKIRQAFVSPAARFKGESEDIVAEMERIHDKYGGLAPDQVVREARAKRSPIHAEFTWDQKKAAAQWRHDQALYLIRNIVIIYERPKRGSRPPQSFQIRRYQRLTEDSPAQDMAITLNDPAARAIYLANLCRRIELLREKLVVHEEFADLVKAMDRSLKLLAA